MILLNITELGQAEGLRHRSRGHRPRRCVEESFCPVRANQFVLASPRHATISPHPRCPYRFFHQRTPSMVDERDSSASMGVSITHSSNFGVQLDYDWRCGRSRSRSLSSDKEARTNEGYGTAKKGFIKIHQNARFKIIRISLAGRIRLVQRESFAFRRRSRIHFEPGGTSPKRDISGGVLADSRKIRRGIRRALSLGLKSFWFALSGRNNLLPVSTEGVALGYNGSGLRPDSVTSPQFPHSPR
jgi:hypothetical protein